MKFYMQMVLDKDLQPLNSYGDVDVRDHNGGIKGSPNEPTLYPRVGGFRIRFEDDVLYIGGETCGGNRRTWKLVPYDLPRDAAVICEEEEEEVENGISMECSSCEDGG